jgi:hypothetical protein
MSGETAMCEKLSVFISHSERDAEYAEALREALKAWKVEVAFDTDRMRASRNWTRSMRHALDESSAVVVLTGDFEESLWMAAEFGAAVVMEKDLIPVLDPKLSPDRVARPLRRRVSIDKGDPDHVAREIARRVHALAA